MELKDLNKQIRVIQNVFIERLKLGKFKVVEQDEYNIVIKMGKYRFILWTANGWECLYVSGSALRNKNSLMLLNMTEKQKRDVWERLETRCKL